MRYIKTFFLLLAACLLFGIAACLLPDKPIQRHIVQTNQMGDLWYDYVTAGIPQIQCRQDNFTDNLILNQAWHLSSDSLLTSLLLVPRSSGPEPLDQANCLYRLIQGEHHHIHHYPRYWHGSTFLMRFLLLFADYPSIRLWFFLISSLLMIVLAVTLSRLLGLWAACSSLLGILLLYPFVQQLSIQFFPVLALMLVGSLLICRHFRDRGTSTLILFILGSLTCYFDLLTTPLLTLGFPLMLFLLLSSRLDPRPAGHQVSRLGLMSIVWTAGYALTWLAKWLLATLFTSENVFQDGFSQAALRSGADELSRFQAVTDNWVLMPLSVLFPILALLLVLVILKPRREGLSASLMLLAVSLLPYLWYICLSNHSHEHFWFTYRSQMVTLSAWFLALSNLIDWSRICRRSARER